MKICCDPGHGGHDTGAVGPNGLAEKLVTLDICHHVECGLSAAGHAAFRTRISDEYIGLQERCDIANEEGADLFISVHANAAPVPQAHGVEIFTSPGVTAADKFATKIFTSIREAFPELHARVDMSDGDPDKESKFWVLVHTKMPAVLLEVAFISNPVEEDRLRDPGWRMRMAGAIVSGINRRF